MIACLTSPDIPNLACVSARARRPMRRLAFARRIAARL